MCRDHEIIYFILLLTKVIVLEAPLYDVFASKDVILSAGAINTPLLLKLSGIGPAAELKKWGIDVVISNPYVGAGLQVCFLRGLVVNEDN